MRRAMSVAVVASFPLALVALGPTMLDAQGHGAKSMLDAVEVCAQEQSWSTSRVGGKLLKVSTPDANLVLVPASLGSSVMLTVDAPDGTPKDERAARREQGRTHGDSLWQCATDALDAARTARDEEREEEREEREERQVERAAQTEANREALKGLMDAVQQSTQPNGGASPAPAGSSSSDSGGFSGSCCINQAFYECPSLEAVNTCSGKFMQCQSGCGFDMDCIGACAESHPLDPSMCSRNTSRDGECN